MDASRFERAGVRLGFWAALSRVLALEERLTHAAHELFLLGGGAEDELLLFWLYFALECRDGELQAVPPGPLPERDEILAQRMLP